VATQDFCRGLPMSLLPLVVAAAAFSDGGNVSVPERRQLASVGCQNCCVQHDCRLAYMMTSPGICCGGHPATGMPQCCPFDATCVMCRSSWRCTRSRYVSASSRCGICRGDEPSQCFMTYNHHSSGSSYSSFLLLMLILFCAIGACAYSRRGGGYDDDVVVVQQGGPPVVTGYTPQGQPIYAQPQVVVQQGGYGGGYGGGGVATGAAAGFVGGMLVGEALDHGGGYGGGYGGGGDMGGGDGGFMAD